MLIIIGVTVFSAIIGGIIGGKGGAIGATLVIGVVMVGGASVAGVSF